MTEKLTYQEREKQRAEAELTLFAALKSQLPQLEELLAEVSGEWYYEEAVYRFYHQSFKVYRAQESTIKIVSALRALLPGRDLNEWFMEIYRAGTGKAFHHSDNTNWIAVTRPILEALFHARFFLEMAVRYGKELDEPVNMLPSGWAAFLYLYNLR